MADSTIRPVNDSTDLRMTASVPTDLRWADTVVDLVGSAGDARTTSIDRAADIQTAAFEAFVDITERCDPGQVHLAVTRTSAGMTVRLSAEIPDWSAESSHLARRVISVLADRAVFASDSIELEFLT